MQLRQNASAQLCAACDDSNDGALAGLAGVTVLDANSNVAVDFAVRCLATMRADGGEAPPPYGMYT